MASHNGRSSNGKSSTQALSIYQELRARGTCDYAELATGLGLTAQQATECRAELDALGLITTDGCEDHSGQVTTVDPEVALLRMLARENQEVELRQQRAQRTHAAVQDLTQRYLRGGAVVPSEVEVEVLTGHHRIQQTLDDLSDTARTEIASMHPGALPAGEFLTAGLERDRRLIEAGVRVRAVYQHRFQSVPALAEFFQKQIDLGVEVRLAAVVPLNMILSDRRTALLPVDPDNQEAGAILARGPALVRSYLALYEYCWHTSAVLGRSEEYQHGSDKLTDQQHAAIRMLAAGMKDERIARSLGISLRTLSRLLSEVMQELGASSRFEAGVRAAKLGWLD
ncbi:helix-turn-helix transcriptional regulator [Kitasatospora acidiphila]|uniref:Helix-turn-helix transcriptional regulator n=1 Tax=Kitasatospora acidiphila TaxID=2567942 RepID=A0A540VYN5_9ACTN|nr:helix-turn-helix transcriptional regulator [Kitasatospora acidiphila]TQF01841.1 helix-turn-helix transcriptional regulator [Kitasatospora acidiphila]